VAERERKRKKKKNGKVGNGKVKFAIRAKSHANPVEDSRPQMYWMMDV
jgi:hypothetical protein